MGVSSMAAGVPSPLVEHEELERLALFKGVDVAMVAPLVQSCHVRELAVGEALIHCGRSNEYLYLVLEGRLSVRLRAADADPLAFIESGETVGELSLIDKQPASASLVAEEPCRVLVLDEEIVWILINTSHAVSSNLIFALVQRMRNGNDLIFESRSRLEQYRFHATVDALTGLFNRHWLNQMLPRQMHRATSSDDPMSLVMIDVDHFKDYNDTHGHLAGDHALGAAAEAVRDSIRPADMAARYGGEEFLVILPSCALEGARTVAERLRSAVETTRVTVPGGGELPGVTASFGIAEGEPEMSMNDFIGRCDEALYRAKRAGRNRVSD